MKVKNLSKHHVDDIAPGKEGEVVDNHATRALVRGGVLEALEALPSEPPPRAKGVTIVNRTDPDGPSLDDAVREIERRGARITELVELVRERDARIAGLEEELAALKDKSPKGRHKE